MKGWTEGREDGRRERRRYGGMGRKEGERERGGKDVKSSPPDFLLFYSSKK